MALDQEKDRDENEITEKLERDKSTEKLDEENMTKVCTMCDQRLPLEAFKCQMKTTASGHRYEYREQICIEDQNVIESYRMKRRREGGKDYKKHESREKRQSTVEEDDPSASLCEPEQRSWEKARGTPQADALAGSEHGP